MRKICQGRYLYSCGSGACRLLLPRSSQSRLILIRQLRILLPRSSQS
ncbi:hypothetical protein A2U01_0031007, partial [Trifolium medium]|nr:hypothetical protein [Trifolium medium]